MQNEPWFCAFLGQLWQNACDPIWWANTFMPFAIFGLLFGWVTSRLERLKTRRAREPYQGWQLIIKGLEVAPQNIFWGEMEKFYNSNFEQWKFIKSSISSYCRIKTPNIEEACGRWLDFPDVKPAAIAALSRDERKITIDLSKMTGADIAVWSLDESDPAPEGWEWKETPPKPKDKKSLVRK